MLYRTLAFVGLALASAAGPNAQAGFSKSHRVAQLAALNPTATEDACTACVNAEVALTTALGVAAAAAQAAEAAAMALANAQGVKATAEILLVEKADQVAQAKAAAHTAIAHDRAAYTSDNPADIVASASIKLVRLAPPVYARLYVRVRASASA